MKSFSITGFAASFLWALMERGSFAVVQFVVQVILARMLMPNDFGMLAVMLSLTNVGIVLVQSGLNTALIREPHVSEDDYSTVLWMSLGMGLILFMGLWACAPLIERACGMAGLVAPLRAMASMLVAGAFVSVCQARLTREMRFRSIFVTSCVSVVASGVAGVGCALAGLGVWALVVQQVGYQVLLCMALGLSLGWVPVPRCDFARAWGLYAFGWKLMVSGLLESGFQGLLSLVVGRQFGSATLGMVDQGRRWPQAVGYLFDGSIQPVTLSSVAKAQHDALLLKRMVRKTLCTYTYLTCPCMAALAVSARPVVALLLGEQWLECVPFLQMYCVVYALLPVHTINLQAVNALGRSDLSLKLDVVKKAYGIALLLFGAFAIGDVRWTIGSLVVGGIAGALVDAIPARRLYGYTLGEQARDVVPAFALAIVCAALAWPIGLTDMGYAGTLAVQAVVALGTYVGFSALARVRGFEYARQRRRAVRRHPEKVRLVLEPRNTYGDPAYKPLFGRVFAPIARGRYLATCEGDDYWTSNTKLQRQFDYMEKHVSCVLCCHATRIVREDGGASSKLLSFGSEDRDITCDEIMRGWAEDKGYGITSLHPSSWFSRRQTDLDYAESWHIGASMGDFMRACYFSHIAPVHFFAEPMSAYRYLARESWTSAAESNADVLAQHYAEYLEVAQEIDSLTGFEYHDSAMTGCKQRALLLAGMTSGFAFFKTGRGRPIAQYLTLGDRMTLIALRTLNALGLRPARNTATGRISVRRLR